MLRSCFLPALVAALAVRAAPSEHFGPVVDASNTSLALNKTTAVLLLDCINGGVAGVRNSTEGKDFIAGLQRLERAAQSSDALVIYSQLALHPGYPELAGPFKQAIQAIGANFTMGSNATYIIPELRPRPQDVIVVKKRYNAAFANDLLLILSSQGIQRVVLSGIITSGVVLSTAYTLFDNNYNVVVARNATIEAPPGPQSQIIQAAILGAGGILERLPATVVSI